MRGSTRILALIAMALVAGCAEPATTPDAGTAPTSSTAHAEAPAADVAAVEEIVPIAFDGTLGTSLHGCVFATGTCESVEPTPAESELLIERPGANFTGLDVEMTWSAQTPATATLTLGWRVMATCDGCNNSTRYDEVTGPSPLRARLTGESVPLTPDHRIHVYVYNAQGLIYDPSAPAYAFVSVDQPFHIEGTVTVVASAS